MGRVGAGGRWRGALAGLGLAWALGTARGAGLESVAGVVTSGAGDAAAGTLGLTGTVGQVVADSDGAEALPGQRVQVGYEVHAARWNRPPVAGGDSLMRPLGERVTKVRLATLLANDTDADGEALTLVGVGRAEPSGATVTVVAGFAVYVAGRGDAGHGSFEYEVADGAGNVVTGWVTVLEVASGVVGTRPNAVRLEVAGADRVFTGIGVPGRRYRVQYTLEGMEPYVWRDFVPVAEVEAATSGALGVFRHVDVAPGEGLRLYRAVSAP